MTWSPEEIKAFIELKTKLLDLAEDLDKLYRKSQKIRIVGKALSFVGGVTSIVAVTFLTGGLAAPVLAAGAAVSVTASATVLTNDIVELVVSKKKLASAQVALENFRKVMCGFSEAIKGVRYMTDATRALQQIVTGKHAVKHLGQVEIVCSSASSKLARFTPVLSTIFLAFDVVDILKFVVNKAKGEKESDPGKNMRRVIKTFNKIFDNEVVPALARG